MGSSGSGGPGRAAVFTAQNRHPRVQVSPSSMMVAVACSPFQHSPILGHWASSQTVDSFLARRLSRRRRKRESGRSAPTAGTRNQFGRFAGCGAPTRGYAVPSSSGCAGERSLGEARATGTVRRFKPQFGAVRLGCGKALRKREDTNHVDLEAVAVRYRQVWARKPRHASRGSAFNVPLSATWAD